MRKVILFFSLILGHTVLGQQLSGHIVSKDKKALAQAYITNTSKQIHTHSNAQGYFTIDKVAKGDTILISHIGYQSQEVVVKEINTDISISLSPKAIIIDEVMISPDINALHLISDIDLQTTPVNTSQDVLRKVPGLIIGQHAGGGKAEQIFLRGFDIDHGTDINITVDGLPVNMVSHAHGQGYADLHFLIPEVIENIDFGKGPYYANKGNFTTAGYVDFKTKKQLEHSRLKLEGGQFNTLRLLGLFQLLDESKQKAYFASEYMSSDGPFESPQNFKRINYMGKYANRLSPTDDIEITATHFTSQWDASGQIPQRSIDKGTITRFGAIDDTEGGTTSRSNFLIRHDKKIDQHTSITSSAYYSKYDFELYSNFTFFLEDPIHGDQIKQKEDRSIYGFSSEYLKSFSKEKLHGDWKTGLSLRYDESLDNELSHTADRSEIIEAIKLGDIYETNLGAYTSATIHYNKWTLNPSLRLDYFDFQYRDELRNYYKTQKETKAILSPKFNLLYNASKRSQLYLKTGKGFHSNDTRVVVAQGGETILPAAYGADAGYLWKPSSKMLINVAYWYLFLEQEFVYVGDAGIVEPSGKSERQGLDFSCRYQPLPWLFWDLDANYTYARAIEESEGNDYIPLAPDFTLSSGINIIHHSGLYGSFHLRHIDDRPANEDNTIVAKGYTVCDFNAGFEYKNMNFGLQIQNMFNTEWNETQFATESRLKLESRSVEEIHFTPGTPFFAKVMVEYKF